MTGFLLNLQILQNRLAEKMPDVKFHSNLNNDRLCLRGMQLYSPDIKSETDYVYLTDLSLIQEPAFCGEGAFLFVGTEEDFYRISLSKDFPWLMLSGKVSAVSCFNALQQIFLYYTELERKINQVLNHGGRIKEIVSIATEHFKSALFFHDEYYHIIARMEYLESTPDIQYDVRKGAYIQDARIINQFRTSKSYMATMKTRGGHLWESDYDDSRAVYSNIWVNDTYKGRLVLTEDSAPLTPSAVFEIGYFAQAVSILVKYRDSLPAGNVQLMEQMILNAVTGKEPEKTAIKPELYTMGWKTSDTYICGAVSLIGSGLSRLSICSICAEIEEQVAGSYTCYHQGYIYMVVNLTQGKLSAKDLRTHMVYLIRDGLMHMGVSNVFYDFFDFPVYIKQAILTLEYSEKKSSTLWYNEFRTYALEYWITEGINGLIKKAVIPSELWILKDYDEKNNSRLLETLKVYLESERNSTLTSQILQIHRSTLPYRLNHIHQLIGVNLDDSETRLYLRMGFYAMDKM